MRINSIHGIPTDLVVEHDDVIFIPPSIAANVARLNGWNGESLYDEYLLNSSALMLRRNQGMAPSPAAISLHQCLPKNVNTNDEVKALNLPIKVIKHAGGRRKNIKTTDLLLKECALCSMPKKESCFDVEEWNKDKGQVCEVCDVDGIRKVRDKHQKERRRVEASPVEQRKRSELRKREISNGLKNRYRRGPQGLLCIPLTSRRDLMMCYCLIRFSGGLVIIISTV